MLARNTSVGPSALRLAQRRRLRRRRVQAFLLALAVLALGGVVWGLWQPALRITHVTVSTGDARIVAAAQSALAGSYLWIIPHNSTLFFQENRVRSAILKSDPSIEAVSIKRNGTDGIVITPTGRTPIARWCGLAPSVGVPEYCYVFDTNGYIFAALPDPLGASTTEKDTMRPSNSFSFYGQLAASSTEPLGATIAEAPLLPSLLDFARQVGTLGTSVQSIVIRDKEVDDLLTSGTRVTYLLGNEEDALTALVSAKNNLNLSDGSLEYVDLRFPGKVYVKAVDKGK